MTLRKLTPILFVERIEPVLPFWAALGLSVQVQVPHGDHLGFVILTDGRLEVMYQSFDSGDADLPALQPRSMGTSTLYLEVEDLSAVESRLAPDCVVVPRRTTPYGAQEVFVREPAGHVVGFAQFARD